MLRVKATAVATICITLIGCGGGSSDPESTTPPDSNNNVLTGIFVDSAVEGASYSTATQSGTTNAQGQFNYMVGEQVTFSIGATQLPTVTAAAQVSPVDMGAGNTATTTNIARFLQSLDSDGNPDNGITITTEAAATVAAINFNVSIDEFANNTDVINLVANSGSTTTALISAADANAHLNDTLGTTDQESTDGIWIRNSSSSSGTGLPDYSLVNGPNISRYNSTDAGCYTVSTNTATPLGDNRYQLNADDGPIFYTAVRVGETLEVTFDGKSTLVYPLAIGVNLVNLPLCDSNIPEEEVILDLRDSTWIANHNAWRCPTGSQDILRYSQTRFSGERITFDENCDAISSSWDGPFSEDGSGFMFLCGGDAICTYEEINRSETLTANDPRNGCTDAAGEPRPVTRQISHEPGSNYFEYTHCSNDDGYRGRYVRQ